MKQNSSRIRLGKSLEKRGRVENQNFWRHASESILASRKNRPSVSLRTISSNSKEGSKVVVPGKVLGTGTLDHKVTVVAYSFSEGARAKILASGGECVRLSEFMENSKDSKGVLILG
jgi:large subunit ribosomal protein L18e